jgi:hypothetical protein
MINQIHTPTQSFPYTLSKTCITKSYYQNVSNMNSIELIVKCAQFLTTLIIIGQEN